MTTNLVLLATSGVHSPGASLHYWQAIILGVIQGVTELFPVSSIGHTVVLPALFGWHNVVAAQSAASSFWLAFIVGLHVGTAVALLVFYRRDWLEIGGALVGSLLRRRVSAPSARLGWLLVVATIPAAIVGVAFEKVFREAFAKPSVASLFLLLNGFVLASGEVLRRRAEVLARRRARLAARAARAEAVHAVREPGTAPLRSAPGGAPRRLDNLEPREAFVIGVAQVFSLIAGISRSGITMVAGIARGLDHEDAARFSFLLATPVILLAGLYKLPELLGPVGAGVRGQTVAAAIFAEFAAWLSVRFLSRWFERRTLGPFALYCVIAGSLLLARFG